MRVCLINESYSLTLTVLFMSETNTSTVNFNIMSMVNDVHLYTEVSLRLDARLYYPYIEDL